MIVFDYLSQKLKHTSLQGRHSLLSLGLIILGLVFTTDVAQAQVSCPLISTSVTANATSMTCSATASSDAPSVQIANNIGLSFNAQIIPNTGAAAPVTATCTGGGCFAAPSGGTINCDSTTQPCNVSYSFPDANGDTVSGSFTAPAYGGGGATILPHIISGGVFNADSTPPPAPDRPTMTDDTGFSATDYNTTDTTPTFTGTVEPNAAVRLFFGGATIGPVMANGAGEYTIALPAQSDGSYSSQLNATDAAGNVSAPSGPWLTVIDTSTPAAAGAPDLAASSDTGVSDTDNITTDATPTFTGTVEAGTIVALLRNGVQIESKNANASTGAYSITQNTPMLGVATYAIRVSDRAGNVAADSPGTVVTVESAFPTEPSSVDLQAGSDTGPSDTDDITQDTTPAFTVSGVSGVSSVKLFSGSTEIGTALVSGASVDITASTLSGGLQNITARTVSIGGYESSDSPALPITIDNSAPTVTSITRGFLGGGPQIPETTDADIVSWFILFSENIARPVAADFSVTGTTSSVTISEVGPDQYEISLADGDIATVNGAVTLNFAGGQTITDTAGNALTNVTPSGANDNSFTMVNNTVPAAPSGLMVTRIINPNPGNAAESLLSLSWSVSADDGGDAITRQDLTIYADPFCATDVFTGAIGLPAVTSADVGLSLTAFSVGAQPSFTIQAVNSVGSSASSNCVSTTIPVADNTAPSLTNVSIASNNSNSDLAKSGDVITLSITAGEALAAAPTVTIAGQAATVSGSGTSWTATVTVLPSTALGVSAINISSFQDASGNAGTTVTSVTDSSSVTIGRVPETPTNLQITEVLSPSRAFSPGPTAATLVEVGVRWTENALNGSAGTVFAPYSLKQFRNGTCSSPQYSASGFDFGMTSIGPLLNRSDFPEGTTGSMHLTATNDFGESAPSNCVNFVSPALDLTAPTVTSVVRTTPATENTDANTLTWTVTFDESVSSVDSSDFEFTGTTANASVTMQSPTVYQVTASGGDLATYNGQVGLAFAAGQNIADQSGFNAFTNTVPTGLNQTYQLTNDNTLPTLTSIVRKTPLGEKTNADSLTWTVTFSEDVQNLDAADFSLSGTTATVGVIGSGAVYDVTASGGDLAGLGSGFAPPTVSLALVAGQNIQDTSGNALTSLPATGATESYIVNNGALTIASITRVDSGTQAPATQLTNADNLAWNVQFSSITGEFSLSPADFSLSGTSATVTSISRYSIGFIVRASGGDLANLNGDVSLSFSATTPTDEFGNPFTNKTPSGVGELTYTLDNAAPTVVSITRGFLVSGGQIPATTDADIVSWFVKFSEDIARPVANDFAVTGTTSSVTISQVGADEYEISLAGGDIASVNGTVTLNFAGGQTIADTAGNALSIVMPSGANDNTFVMANDTVAPSVTITSGVSDPVSGAFSAIFTFSEDVTGFTIGDVSVGNGAASNFAAISSTVYTATITPSADGPVTIDVAAGVAQDSAGNTNIAATRFSITNDTSAPTVTASTPPSSVNGPFDIVFSFTEDMSGLTADDFDVTNGTVTLSGGPRVFTVTITPDGNGDVSVSLPANVATDPAGNGNEAFNATFQVEFDSTPPTVSVSTPPPSANGPFDLIFTFTEDMTGLTASDFNVENGTVTLTGGPREFTVTITPDGNGDVSVNLPANVAFDLAGNGNEAFNAVIEVSFDVIAPSLVLSTATSDVTGPFTVTATFLEAVTGFTADDIVIENGSLSDFSGSDAVFTATVTPVTIGEIVMTIADGAASDLAGNASTGDTLSVTAGGGNAVVELEVTTAVLDASTVGTEFTLSNPGTQPIFFSASSDQPWVDVTPGSGKIDSLSNIEFDIQLNDLIDDLAPGTYVATVIVEIVDGPTASAGGVSANSNAITRNILAEVPITVEVEERFGNFELIVLTPTGPTAGASFQYTSDITALNGLSVAANEGQRQTSLANLLQGAYTLQQSVPDGYFLKTITCSGDRDGGTVVDIEAAKVDLDLDASESISCIFENARDEDAIRIATQRAIRNFMARRGDRVLEATPDLSKRFANRRRTEGGQFMASGSEFRTNMDFETSLSGLRNKASEKDDGAWNDLRDPKANKWDLWMSAEYTRYEDERADSGIDGKFFAAQFGVDYLLKENLIVGAMVQYDWMSELDKEPAAGLGTSVGADVEGEGLMAGPYVVWQAKEQLTIDVMGLWGSSENTVNPLGYYSDQFETDRFLVRANVTGEFASGPWRLRPQVSLSHYQDKQADYVDSLGIIIPDQVVTIGRLRAGPEVVWTHKTEKGSQLEIGGSVRAVWNYNGAGLMDQSGFISSGSDPVRADGEVSIGTRLANGISLRATAGFDGIGKGDFSARSGRLEFVFPFGGKGGDTSTLAANPLQQAGFHRACETDGFLQSMNRAVPAACRTEPRANLLDTNIAMMTAR
ncbi:hypothetical protein GCM10007853_21410 [Algimonas ampicilliniresistens]|uniref:Autotransporter domain-containing protein n=1 Tax=Algimonas ampicilliniresistens TaxID=1298735 RepID=A0ABQ5VB09_9PROT|nr:hypothetical protein GCM10007853_21410 [Algimonas ampicilliniresistens]